MKHLYRNIFLFIVAFVVVVGFNTQAKAGDDSLTSGLQAEIASMNAVLDVALSQSLKTSDTVLDRVYKQGSLPVIIKLRDSDLPYGSFANKAKPRTRTIRGLQDRVLNDVVAQTGHNQTRLHAKRFKMIPAMALQVDGPGMKALLANPNVIDIVEDIAVPPTLQDSVPLIGAGPDGSFATFTGQGQTVAILDTGVDKNHPFLNGKVVYEACYSTTSSANSSTSVCPGGVEELEAVDAGLNCDAAVVGCGHGTHVAGIAAGNNATFSGVAQDADIIAIQIFSRFDDTAICGSAAKTPCALSYTSDQIKGLERVYELRSTYAIASANMSLGGGAYTSFCDTAYQKPIIDLLREAGIATVIASGNDGYIDAIGSPGCISSAISVGSTTKSDAISSFSNSADFLSLLAPGSSIESSIPGTGYSYWNGTSMATPHVTGAWAVIKQAKPGASVTSVLNAFQSFGVPVTDTRTGAGNRVKTRISVENALMTFSECDNNADCDDGLFCNGVEACINDVCVAEDDPCEICDETTGSCSYGSWIHRDDGTPVSALGFTNGGTMTVASHWQPAEIPDGGVITTMRVGVNHIPSNAVIQIWQGSDDTSMELQYSQAFTPLISQINEIVLDTPYVIDDSQELFIGWSATHSAGQYPCLYDADADASQQGDLLFNGGIWQHLSSGDWIIHAFIEDICFSDEDCSIAGQPYCVADTCVECQTDQECDNTLWCDGDETCNSGWCIDQADPCLSSEFCDETSAICLECLTNADCPNDTECDNSVCVPVVDPIDSDFDGIIDNEDNCPDTCNPQQLDADDDDIGDVCDQTPGCGGCGQPACEAGGQCNVDQDNDGIVDDLDNCPDTCNSEQLDADQDDIGDVCDAAPGCGGCGAPACEEVCTP